MGKPLGLFIDDVMSPLPLLLKPVAVIAGMFFLGFVFILLSGMRIWTWFFTIEPANLAQDQVELLIEPLDLLTRMLSLLLFSHERDTAIMWKIVLIDSKLLLLMVYLMVFDCA